MNKNIRVVEIKHIFFLGPATYQSQFFPDTRLDNCDIQSASSGSEYIPQIQSITTDSCSDGLPFSSEPKLAGRLYLTSETDSGGISEISEIKEEGTPICSKFRMHSTLSISSESIDSNKSVKMDLNTEGKLIYCYLLQQAQVINSVSSPYHYLCIIIIHPLVDR